MHLSFPDINVLNIVSVSYSGSTWLNLMLGSHPQTFSLGEIDYLFKRGFPRCMVHGDDCPLWSRFNPSSTVNPYVQISEITGRKTFIVNNVRRSFEHLNHPRIDLRHVLLIRDGRAVISSQLRKFPELSTWHVARKWSRSLHKKCLMIDRLPSDRAERVRYEDLVTDFEMHAAPLFKLMSIDPRRQMREFWTVDHHPLGGNRGPVAAIADYQNREPDTKVVFEHSRIQDVGHYLKTDPGSFRDERWKHELSDWQLRIFALATGRLNRRLGYPAALDRS